MNKNANGSKIIEGKLGEVPQQLPDALILLIKRTHQVIGSRIIRLSELCKKTGRAPSTAWKDVRNGTFPPPVRLGPRAVGWRESEIDAWLDARLIATRCKEIPFDMAVFVNELISFPGISSQVEIIQAFPKVSQHNSRTPSSPYSKIQGEKVGE